MVRYTNGPIVTMLTRIGQL